MDNNNELKEYRFVIQVKLVEQKLKTDIYFYYIPNSDANSNVLLINDEIVEFSSYLIKDKENNIFGREPFDFKITPTYKTMGSTSNFNLKLDYYYHGDTESQLIHGLQDEINVYINNENELIVSNQVFLKVGSNPSCLLSY